MSEEKKKKERKEKMTEKRAKLHPMTMPALKLVECPYPSNFPYPYQPAHTSSNLRVKSPEEAEEEAWGAVSFTQ